MGGFSDGASYALSVGLTNGDLFTQVIAFSPGFMAPAEQVGESRIYVSHVRYREFDGPHTVPANLARESVEWLAAEGG